MFSIRLMLDRVRCRLRVARGPVAWRAATSALVLAAVAVPSAGATTITAYDQLSTAAQATLVEEAVADIARRYAGDPGVPACIDDYTAPTSGGAAPQLDEHFAGLVERSRAVAPDDFEVENLLHGLIMVECSIAPEDAAQ